MCLKKRLPIIEQPSTPLKAIEQQKYRKMEPTEATIKHFCVQA
jgi:hypothetical protein